MNIRIGRVLLVVLWSVVLLPLVFIFLEGPRRATAGIAAPVRLSTLSRPVVLLQSHPTLRFGYHRRR
jgi:hypothetical protein